MSKMDGLRAMREARYAKNRATATPVSPPRRAAPSAPEPVAVEPSGSEPAGAGPEVRLCGHRAISGRTCTREHGHAAKSHRYS